MTDRRATGLKQMPPAEGGRAFADSYDPLSRAAYACVLLAVPLSLCNGLRITKGMTYGDPFLLIAGVLLTAVWLRHGHPKGVLPRWILLAPGLLLGAGLLAIVPSDSSGSLVPTLRFTVTLAGMPLVLMFAASTNWRVKSLVNAWLAAAVANSMIGLLDVLGVTAIGPSVTPLDFIWSGRASALTLHPNHLGLVAAMAVPVALSKISGNGLHRAIGLAVLLLLLAGVAVSGSRGALGASIGGIALFFLLQVRSTRSRSGIALCAVLLAAFAFLIFTPAASERVGLVVGERILQTSGETNRSDALRQSLYSEALREGVEDPFIGRGFDVVLDAHNIYLQLLQAGGLLALAGFLIFAIGITGRARMLVREARLDAGVLPALVAASGASVGTWLLFGMAGNALFDRYLYVPAGCILAIGLAYRRAERTASATSGGTSAAPKRLAIPTSAV